MPAHWHPYPAILDRIPKDRHAVIEASAGTGKTHTLEHLVVDMLLAGRATIQQILVVTFTEKATWEMRQRIRQTIQRVLEGPPAGTHPERGWLIDGRARQVLQAALHDFDSANISTIHAFCQMLLSEEAFAAGRLLKEEVVDARSVFGRVFRAELRTALAKDDPLRPLLEVVLRKERPETLEEGFFHFHSERGLMEPALGLDGYVALVRGLPTVEEMAPWLEKLCKAAGNATVQPKVKASLEALAIVGGKARAATDGIEVLGLVKGWKETPIGKAEQHSYTVSKLETAYGKDSSLKDSSRAIWDVLQAGVTPLTMAAQMLMPRIRARMSTEKAQLAQIDFDDMLVHARDALQGSSGPALVERVAARFKVALVDESQDTDALQWEIFRRLFVEGGPGRVLYLVGDPKQAIYSFRNADVHTYQEAKTGIQATGGALVPLVQNFRSTVRMIDAVNLILERDFFTGHNRYDHPVTCGKKRLSAEDRHGAPLAPVVLINPVGDATPGIGNIRHALHGFVAAEIPRLLDGGMRMVDGPESAAIRPRDIHILVRTREDAQGVALVLREAGIPHALFKSDGLFETQEARDVRDVLRAILDPADRAHRYAAWLTPFFGLSLQEMGVVEQLDTTHPFWARLVNWRVLAERHDYARLFRSLVEDSGLVRRLLLCNQGERELTNYLHVMEILQQEAYGTRRSLHALAGRLQAFIDGTATPRGHDEDIQRLETEREAVQILTMHASKGLEAAVVFVLGGFKRFNGQGMGLRLYHQDGKRRAWIGKPPAHIQELVDAEEQQESERLLYVAVTRARARLYLPLIHPTGVEGGAVMVPKPAINGAYTCLRNRLIKLVEGGAINARTDLFSVVEAPVDWDAQGASHRGTRTLPSLPEAPAIPEVRWESLRLRHAPLDVTSYTRLKKQHVAPEELPDPEREAEQFMADAVDAAADGAPESTLPGGAAMGILLHELLETSDYAEVRAAPDVLEWGARTAVRERFDAALRRHAVDAEHLEECIRVVHTGLRAPLPIQGGTLEHGVVGASSHAVEMSMLFPMPARTTQSDLPAERGFVRGVVDVVFEYGGRMYFLDWKSDRLASFSEENLRQHMRDNYGLQACLYTLGMVRLLRLMTREDYDRRFGGLVYCFLRGMKAGSTAGSIFDRPGWEQVQAWERTLGLETRQWIPALEARP